MLLPLPDANDGGTAGQVFSRFEALEEMKTMNFEGSIVTLP